MKTYRVKFAARQAGGQGVYTMLVAHEVRAYGPKEAVHAAGDALRATRPGLDIGTPPMEGGITELYPEREVTYQELVDSEL